MALLEVYADGPQGQRTREMVVRFNTDDREIVTPEGVLRVVLKLGTLPRTATLDCRDHPSFLSPKGKSKRIIEIANDGIGFNILPDGRSLVIDSEQGFKRNSQDRAAVRLGRLLEAVPI